MLKQNLKPLSEASLKYLTEERKLSKEILDLYRIQSTEKGLIAIPFYDETDYPSLLKFRHPTGGLITRIKTDDNGQKEQIQIKTDCKPGGRAVLLGSHLANPQYGPLVISFGDYDSLSIAQDGVPNSVSMPFGDLSHKFIEEQFDFLESFDEIILYPDIDRNPRTARIAKEKLEQLIKRLGIHRCSVVQDKFRYDTKDPNELLVKKGKGFNKIAVENAKPYEIERIYKLAHITDVEIKSGISFGIGEFDRITGGMIYGNYLLVSGDNNAGKSTLMLKLISQFIKYRIKVFYWSGEQKPKSVRGWFEQICAGPNFIASRIDDRSKREYKFADPRVEAAIRQWYEDYLFVFDKRSVESEELFEVYEFLVRRHGVKAGFIDNLMAFTGGTDDYWAAQGDFCESLKMFSEEWDVFSCLIAHNKKTENTIPTKDDVEGNKKITNWADYVIQCARVMGEKMEKVFPGIDAVYSMCKNRETEELSDVRMIFDRDSKRLVQKSEAHLIDEKFGWEDESHLQYLTELENTGLEEEQIQEEVNLKDEELTF